MSSNLIRSLGLVSAVAIIPAATAGFAAVDVGTYRELEQFMTVFERVRSEYVEQVDDKTLMRGAIDGMLNALDPHSSYLDEKGFRSLMTTTEGEYGGLGLSVTMEDGTVKVIAATEDTPARPRRHQGGRLPDPSGRQVALRRHARRSGRADARPPWHHDQGHRRPPGRDKPFDVSLTRAIIELKTVKWEIKDRIGIINVNGFDKTVTDSTLAAINAIEKSIGGKPLGYILDLRSNPGGLLDQRSAFRTCSRSRRGRLAARPQKGDIERYYARPGDAAKGCR
jgi:carboxyl-terminal processing protease